MPAIVQSIQVGKIRSYTDPTGKTWQSAIEKVTVDGPVEVQPNGLVGDQQADTVHHGGVDKAVHGYSGDHFADWQKEFPEWSVKAGCWGENLTIQNQTERDVCIGDVFQIGSCRLQVSQPREPCWKLARINNLDKLPVRVQQLGRTGWYFRVFQLGVIQAGDAIELVERADHGMTIERANQIMFAKPRNPADDLALANCPQLSDAWQEGLERRASGKT